MRLAGLSVTLLLLTGCAPTGAGAPPGEEGSARRCVSTVGVRLIAFDNDRVFVRSRTGQALELTGQAACLNFSGEGAINVRPGLGPDTGNICVGEAARVDIVAASVNRRTCNVQVARIVPESEISQLPHRRSP